MAKVVMPWNAVLWWMTTKLRLAIELDCDLRTVRAPVETTRYARLLLLIAQRQQEYPPAPMLAVFDSHLSMRIASMNRPAVTFSSTRVLAALVVAIVAGIAACSPTTSKVLTAAGSPAPDVSSVFHEWQVATQVAVLPESTAPHYPAELRSAKVEGEVVVQFVVDTAGVVELTSFKVVRPGEARFAEAIKVALPGFRYSPARLADGRKVRQLVQQPFAFALAR